MAEVFTGRWRLLVISKNAVFDQRLRIEGAVTGNGIFDGLPGVTAEASGSSWTVALEWNSNTGSGWQESAVRPTPGSISSIISTVELRADDNFPDQRDGDFDDLIVLAEQLPETPNICFQIPDTLTESDLTARLRSALTADATGSTDAVVWQDRGDEVVVHLSTLQIRLAPPAVFAAVELESDQTGRHSVIVRFVFGGPDDPAGLFATTDEVVRGNSLLAARWGPIFRDLVWSALIRLSSNHAAERGLAPLQLSVGSAGLQLAASKSVPLPQRIEQILNPPAPPAGPTPPR
jgi:hypothetical protein